jgi:hypothetical protein
MSEQLPPVDPALRRQLSRRSAGPIPSGLLSNTVTWLDATSRPRRWRFAMPRTLAALGSVAVVALVVAALVIVPSIRQQPAAPLAGYPAQRALTTAELGKVLAGPELMGGTTLIASVRFDSEKKCDDYLTQYTARSWGVIDGLSPQVCVVFTTRPSRSEGVFAFHYDGRELELIAEIAPASDRLSFKVTDAWPIDGAFVVRGYLGALLSPTSCPARATWGAPLPINDCPYTAWLSDDPTAPFIEDKVAKGWNHGEDQLSLRGRARYVLGDVLGGFEKPVFGVYVVQKVVGPCSALPETDSRGCEGWRVLAKVPNLSLPAIPASPTPAPSAGTLTGYPADRALTTAELADLMSGPTLATNTTFVATVTIDAKIDVCPMNRAPTIGVIEGMPSQVCVMGQGVSDYLQTDKVSGTFVFQYWVPGYLGLLGEVAPASPSQLAFRADETWPTAGRYLVEGQLHRANVVGKDPAACPAQTPDPSGGVSCSQYWLGGDSDVSQWRFDVAIDATYQDPATGLGVFLVGNEPCVVDTTPNCHQLTVHARVADDPFAAIATPTPTQAPTSTAPTTPIPEPPATPLILPTTPAGAQPLGLWGQGNRPFTVAELPALYAADPNHLANRIVIVKGPVPAGFLCWSAGDADAGISPPPCHIGVEPSQIAADGHYWAVKVGPDGKLTVLGEIKTPGSGYFVEVPEASANPSLKDGDLNVVFGTLNLAGLDGCDSLPQPSGGCLGRSVLSGADLTGPSLPLTPGTYQSITGLPTQGMMYTGYFLIQFRSGGSTVLAMLSTVPPEAR